jgi:hypothetical protein
MARRGPGSPSCPAARRPYDRLQRLVRSLTIEDRQMTDPVRIVEVEVEGEGV